MIQNVLIFSPAIVVLIASLVCLILGLVGLYRLKTMKAVLSPTSLTSTLMIAGCFGSVGASIVFAITSFYVTIILRIMIAFGCSVLFLGEYFLCRNILLRRRNLFAPWLIFFGACLAALSFPLSIHLHEPFTFLYVCVVAIGIPSGQIILIRYMIKKRRNIN